MTETDSMVVRVAKAINAGGMAWLNENDPKRMSLSWADVPDEVFARAAIEAMKEPTTGMVEAGAKELRETDRPPYLDDAQYERQAAIVWRAMIVKALEE